MLIGDPFTIDGTSYSPEDVMNYDEVGFALVGEATSPAVIAAHKTLPVPSYIEVTHLDSGRTVLVRIEARGPMQNDVLVGLSRAAAVQLGIADGARAPVRVRRVNPPEAERAVLRAGGPVPPRMDTPPALLVALKRKLRSDDVVRPVALPKQTSLPPRTTRPPKASVPPVVEQAPDQPEKAAPPPLGKGHFVQIGAFSNEANARMAADKVSATVSKGGNLWLVRMGPYANRAQADAALAKARSAGYGDAIVRRVN